MAPHSVLVTGSSGFIGRHVVRQLAASGHKVTATDYRPQADPLPDAIRFHRCDLRSDPLPCGDFSAIIHLAALAGVRPSLDRPLDYEETNVLGTLRLLDHCRQTGIGRFVLASSSSVYGPDTPLPAEETALPGPQSPYALTKLHAEQWGRLYAKLHGLNFVALRFFSVWGPGQRHDLALEAFRRKIEARQPVVINGDGSHCRDLVFPPDSQIPRLAVPPEAAAMFQPYPDEAPPVFFGHYFKPADAPLHPERPNVACLDHSAAKDGPLVAYRWQGETRVKPGNYVLHDTGAEQPGD